MIKKSKILSATLILSVAATAAPFLIEANGQSQKISPFIYGKNHDISQKIGVPTSDLTLQRHKDAGFKMLRLNNGNNSSKYNWAKKISSHPDWYNNVYSQSWDQSAQEVEAKLPGVNSLYALSLIGFVADTNANNFKDGLYNGSSWWDGTTNNWAGTPAISAAGEVPVGVADPTKYLTQVSADQTLGILDHWFGNGPDQLGLDSTRLRYWNMDNEADIWNYTHDDIISDTITAENFVQRYVEMAIKARTKFPGIKLVGPVLTNEWQWYFWNNKLVTEGAKDYTVSEYFIKRISEEQSKSGLKLLDVFDVHFYPGYNELSDKANILQMHRVWFDTNYVYPKANGIKVALGSSKPYYFKRIGDWLTQYMGANHGVTFGITECGAIEGVKEDASATAVWYASHLGEFASQGNVEIFTPWDVYEGIFETAHLFTSYAKENALQAIDDANHIVSVYPTINASKDSLTLMVINRNLTNSSELTIDLSGFEYGGTWAPTFDIANLKGETFISSTKNGIYKNGVDIVDSSLTLSVPKLSVTAIVLTKNDPGVKPTFPPRDTIADTTGTGNNMGDDYVLIWDYNLGAQVNTPEGKQGGWWYDYADPLSTINAIDATEIKLNKALEIKFDGVQDAEQNYNYAGLGFNWSSGAIDLSAYDEICVEYKSTVGLRSSIVQPDPTNASKTVDYMTPGEALAASDTKVSKCLKWSEFGAGTALDLKKQLRYQVQAEATAEFTFYSVSLHKNALSPNTNLKANPNFSLLRQGDILRLKSADELTKVQIFDLRGRLLLDQNLSSNEVELNISNFDKGMFLIKVNNREVKSFFNR